MTDRHAAYIVVLNEDVPEDDAEPILTALRMVKGVAGVEPVIRDRAISVAEARANREWVAKLVDLIRKAQP